MPSIVGTVANLLSSGEIDIASLGLAWARAMPLVILVPAFGLRAMPPPARSLMALVLAASVFPAIASPSVHAEAPWPVLAGVEVARGALVALSTAIPLWAATMAGGVVDALRGSQETLVMPTVEGRPTPMGVPLSLLACAIFLGTGGPARAAAALATHSVAAHPVVAAVDHVVEGITLAVALAGPILAAAVIVEIAAALVARAASPAQVQALLAPIRALSILAVFAVLFERLASTLARTVSRLP
jgi:type III secretory pathway component EscT